MLYSNEYQILCGLKKHLENTKQDIDIALYEIMDTYLKNPFNVSKEELEILNDFSVEKKQFDVYALTPNKGELKKILKHIMPCKLSKPTAKIRNYDFKKNVKKTHIPVSTKILRLAA